MRVSTANMAAIARGVRRDVSLHLGGDLRVVDALSRRCQLSKYGARISSRRPRKLSNSG